ncbi:MAG: thiamine phosphate synthase [Gammaproteobacteria bacterium]
MTDARIGGLYAITDPGLLPGPQLLDAVRAALVGGASTVQYRNKTADAATRLREATSLTILCRDAGALFLVNDDVALALACGAHGVHLGQQDGAVESARTRLGGDAVIGQTCHASLALALAAQAAGADYVAFGRFFPSRTKPLAPPAGITLLPEARAVLHIPIVAIGGVTVDNAPQLIAAGADAVAVIHDLFSAGDVAARAHDFAALFTRGQPA